MKEIKYIIHAFLLLLVILILFIGLKSVLVELQNDPGPGVTIAEDTKSVSNIYVKGKELFMAKCGACHILNANSTGPSLCSFEDRGPWNERENVYQWIKNPQEFREKSQYAKELSESFPAMMTGFPDLTNEEIDEIIKYINSVCNNSIPKAIIANN